MFHHEFGIVESTYCSRSGRWIPSRKEHPFLPLSAWSKLMAHGQLITSLLGNENGPLPANIAPVVAEPIISQSDATHKQHGCPSVLTATRVKKAGARRGRPPKRAAAASSGASERPRAAQKSSHRGRPPKHVAAAAAAGLDSPTTYNTNADAEREAAQFLEEDTVQCGDAGVNVGLAEKAADACGVPADAEKATE